MKPTLAPILLVLAAALSMLWPTSCTPSTERSRLTHIESIIDDQPDSALILLAAIDTTALRSDADRALYAMLSNLAVFKSFSDNLDEEALNHAADYFIDANDYSRASRTLYLLGNFNMSRNQLGGAAISLTRGFELASKNNDFFNQGLCALSLYELYNLVFDANRQLYYSKLSLDAFRKTEKKDWELYAMHNLATSYNNNQHYDSSMSIANEVILDPSAANDNKLLGWAYETLAVGAAALDNDSLAAVSYVKAIEYDSTCMSNNDFSIIIDIISNSHTNTLAKDNVSILKSFISGREKMTPFYVYERENRYKDAYNALNSFRIHQDSIIRIMLSRAVDSSIEEYNKVKLQTMTVKHKSERISWLLGIGFMAALIVILILWLFFKEKRNKEERDLLIDKATTLSEFLSDQVEKNNLLSDNVRMLLHQKSESIEKLCKSYYEKNSKSIADDVKKIINDFAESSEAFSEIENSINEKTDNLLIRFKIEYPDIKEIDYRIYVYSLSGFSGSTIALLLGDKRDVIYNRRSRLKAKIRALPSEISDVFLQGLG